MPPYIYGQSRMRRQITSEEAACHFALWAATGIAFAINVRLGIVMFFLSVAGVLLLGRLFGR